MTAPDYISPIVGYRVWQWDGTGLKSLNGEAWFPNRPIAAACNAVTPRTIVDGAKGAHNTKDVPRAHCTCGIYAARSFAHLQMMGYWRYGIRGEVNLWGAVVEHELGWRAQFAYPKALYLSHDAIPFTIATIQSRLKTLIAYGAKIFIADAKADIRLWTNDSGYDSAGLDYLLKTSKQYYERCRQERTLKKGDRVALIAGGIGVVEKADDNDVHVALGKACGLKIPRDQVVWNQQNIRWEASLAGIFQERRKNRPEKKS